jgi:hypothetical protein
MSAGHKRFWLLQKGKKSSPRAISNWKGKNMGELRVNFIFEENEVRERWILLNALFRSALLELGYSPDEHLENVDRARLLSKLSLASSRFLLRLWDFYSDGLNPLEQRIFYTEVLEKGRHYMWWWFGDAIQREYCKAGRSLGKKIDRYF